MAYKFRNIEKTIGAFIIIAILAFIAGLIFIAKGKKLIVKKNYYTTSFYSAMDLNKGMPVTYKGLTVGQVKDLYLNKDNMIEVKFYVYRKNADRVKEDSVINITAPNPFAAKILALSPGGTNSKIANNNSILYSIHSEEGIKLLEAQISQQPTSPTELVVQNIQILTAQLSNPKGPLMSTLRNLEKFTTAFAGVSGENKDLIGAMIKDLKATTKNFKEMSSSMKNNPLFGGGWGKGAKKKKK